MPNVVKSLSANVQDDARRIEDSVSRNQRKTAKPPLNARNEAPVLPSMDSVKRSQTQIVKVHPNVKWKANAQPGRKCASPPKQKTVRLRLGARRSANAVWEKNVVF